MNLVTHLRRQITWSTHTFGPGDRTVGLLNHISQELDEIDKAQSRTDKVEEWIDVVILAFDGAWRSGFTAEEVAAALEAKQTKNEGRNWPDWRQFTNGEAINHIREPI